MRIDSCRKCGEKLEIQKQCSMCNEAILFWCLKCNYSTERQFHSQCSVPLLKVNSGRR